MAEPLEPAALRDLAKATQYEWSEVRGEYVPVHPSVVPGTTEQSSAGTHLLVDPAAGKGLRVMWLCCQSVASNGDNVVEVTFAYGPDSSTLTNLYKFELRGSQPFPHRAVIDLPTDNNLYVVQSHSRRVLYNWDVRDYTP